MPADVKAPASRIAIKFGGASSSTSSPKAPSERSRPSSTLGKRSRPQVLGAESESESEDEYSGRLEAVTTFGTDGAEYEERRNKAREPKTGRKSILPPEARAQQNDSNKETEPADEDKAIKWGLTVKAKSDTKDGAGSEAGTPSRGNVPASHDSEGEKDAEPRTADQEALDALLGKEPERKRKVIFRPTALDGNTANGGRAPAEVASMADYEEMGDEFGSAMLRGMGWDGKVVENPLQAKRRPNLQGLGAKEDKELKKHEEAKKHGYRERRPRLDEYRSKKDKERERREGKYSDSYKNERERERHRDRERDRDRPRDSYRERDRDRNRERDRDRDRDRHSHRDRDRR